MRIGIFDSGVGGLTVYKEIRKHFPAVEIVYFGDTARVPYGSKSKDTIIDYSLQNARFLISQGAKIIVVACNTASAVALDALHKHINVPVIGVIKAGAKQAITKTKSGKIGVIGTDGTINSHAYLKALKDINPDIIVKEKACPLFVSLAEEGWLEHNVTREVAEIYLAEILAQGIDTLVLGCTHYPLLKKIIQVICGDNVVLVDSAEAICDDLRVLLTDTQSMETQPIDKFFVSDNEEKFRNIAEKILGNGKINLQQVMHGRTWIV